MSERALIIPKVWRSEAKILGVFLAVSLISIILSHQFPGSIITGQVIALGDYALELSLPLFWLAPLVVLMLAIARLYDVRYQIDDMGLECRVGILSLHQHIVRIRYEDVRSVELEQTLFDRLLDTGDVYISTAANAGVEVVFSGVSAPKEVQEMIQRERDRRQKLRRQAPIEERLQAAGA